MISQTVVHQHPDDDDHSDTSDSDSDEDSNQETPNLPKAASGEDSVEESENDDFEDGDDESSTSTSHKPPPDKLMKRNPKKKRRESRAVKNTKKSPVPTDLLSNDGGRRILKTLLNNISSHPKGACGALGHGNRTTFFKDFVDNQSKRSSNTGSAGVLCGFKAIEASVLQDRFNKAENKLKMYIEEGHSSEDEDKGGTCPDEQESLLQKYTTCLKAAAAQTGSKKAKEATAKKKVMKKRAIATNSRPQEGPDITLSSGEPQRKMKKMKKMKKNSNSNRYGGVKNKAIASSKNARKVSNGNEEDERRNAVTPPPNEFIVLAGVLNCVAAFIREEREDKRLEREQASKKEEQASKDAKLRRIQNNVNRLTRQIEVATASGDFAEVEELKTKKKT